MKIDILTLFPDMFNDFKNESIIKRAIDKKIVEINTCNFRDFAKNKHKKVDDTPYGGGAGMVLMCQPIFDAVNSLKNKDSKVVLLSPQGEKYTQEKAYELSKEKHLIMICGHYEGFDERIKTIVDEEISIGDYVLTGGEIPALVLSDSIVRLLPGAIEEESHTNDSFNDNLLDYPTYTKPRTYKGLDVPEVLLSGDHKKIEEYRLNERVRITKEKRPDLIKKKLKLEKNGLKENKYKINIDDIKNIKVTEITNDDKKVLKIKNTNKYKLDKEDKIVAVTMLNPQKIKGYKLRGKTKEKDSNKLVIVKPKFIEKIAIKNIMKKINILTYRLNLVLSSDDDESTGRVLGESEMLKSMIISMYARYLGAEQLDKIIKNINLLVNEFVKAKTLQQTFANKEISSRSR